MKPHNRLSLTKVLPMFNEIFPVELLKQMEQEFLPRGNYVRAAMPRQLIQAMIKAIILKLPSQTEIVLANPRLKLTSRSALSYDLDRGWFQELTREMNEYLNERFPIFNAQVCKHPRILIDTMPLMIQKTQRGTCTKFNNVSKGCGVMCGFNIDACAGQSVVELLKIMHGGWNDTYQVRTLELEPNGPIYIADRGFHGLETIQSWRNRNIHFIVRAKKHNLSYTPLQTLPTQSGKNAKIKIESDRVVMLGKSRSPHRSQVRMVKAWLKNGEDLWLVTDQLELSADQLLESYLQRGNIECYHRFIKQALGLAHLYSLDQPGIESQLQLTVLLVNLLHLSAKADRCEKIKVLMLIDQTLKLLRRQVGITTPWRRNTVAQRRNKPEHNRRYLKQRTSTTNVRTNL